MNSQYSTTPVICYGEILWDVLPDGPQPGGAPLNVAYHLTRLGVSTNIISRIGDDENGLKMERLLQKWGINKDFLQYDHGHPTSQVIARLNNGTEVSYEILFPVAWDFIRYPEAISSTLKRGTYLVYGSLAARSEVSRDTLFQILESDVISVFDINLRPPFVSRDVLEQLLLKADIVKFNQSELEMVQLQFGGSFSSEVSQVGFIQRHFEIPEIIVTKGEFGASYYKNDKAFHAWGSEVKVTDTIGSGDSFLASFIASHVLEKPPKTILRNAIAMGAFIATKKGGCPQYVVEDYENFKNQIFQKPLNKTQIK